MKLVLTWLALVGVTQAQAAAQPYWSCRDARNIADAGYAVTITREGKSFKARLSEQSWQGAVVLGTWAVAKTGPWQGRPLEIFNDKATGGVSLHVSIHATGFGALKAHLKDQDVAASLKCQQHH